MVKERDAFSRRLIAGQTGSIKSINFPKCKS